MDNENPISPWLSLIKKHSTRQGIPWRWMAAIMGQESVWGTLPSVVRGLENPSDVEGSKSSDGKSWGLFQVIPTTADWMLGRPNGTTKPVELNSPEFCADVSARYIAYCFSKAKKQSKYAVFDYTIMAYNGGPGNIGSVATLSYLSKVTGRMGTVQKYYPGERDEI